MRLKRTEIEIITDIIRQFDPGAEIRLFGSRVNDDDKGGDIDLLILSSKIKLREKLTVRYKMKEKLGDRKIDLLVTENPATSFTRHAYKNSILL
ncbi:MAG TPA: nucleotidyltransferase domain-containing protein [Bacteroidales bacterium]|nr:nucleotidyltransferase domain-containing protein [Bacteroidales bacterium]